MYRSVLTLETSPERVDRVVERYAELRVLELAIECAGALSCEIAASADGSGALVVLALWPDEAAYRGWLDHPVRAEIGEGLDGLVDLAEGRAFEVRAVVEAGRDS